MRRSFTSQVIVFIAAIVFAFLSSADKEIYLSIKDVLTTIGIYSFIKELLAFIGVNNAYVFSRMIALLVVIILSIYSIVFVIKNEKWIIKQLTISTFNTIFYNIIDGKKLNIKDTNYRVTFYKIYEFNYLNLSWFLQCLKRIFNKERRLKFKKNYLLQYYRYGFENGNDLREKKSTLTCIVDENDNLFHLFAGKVFENKKESFETCLDNKDINNIVSKLLNPDITKKKDIKNLHKDYMFESIESNYNQIVNHIIPTDNDILSSEEKTILKSFMTNTNTNGYSLYSIANGKHSNHFLGFKVYRKGTLFGVVVMDVLNSDYENDFFKIINMEFGDKNQNIKWLNYLLGTFSNIYSNALK